MTELDVYVHGTHAGSLTSGVGKQATFRYGNAYLHGLGTPLSLSIPRVRGDHEVGAWIDGLLPDNPRVREVWADRNGAESTRPVDLLATAVGADCAGAVQFFPAGAGRPHRSGSVNVLTEHEIAEWIRRARSDWAAWGGDGNLGQFSLGGAQAKCALHFDGRQWGLPTGDIPTTHILKPGLDDYDDADIVEDVCLSAARRLGLDAAHTDIGHFEGERVIVVTRFDRETSDDTTLVHRVHQEDLCQALGVPPDLKYQSEGGPTPADVAALIRNESSDPERDLRKFRDALIYNWAIAAPDAHAKNYSMSLAGNRVAMAPLYDVISFLPYAQGEPHWKLRTAMRIGKDYTLRKSSRPTAWERTARVLRLDPDETIERAEDLLRRTPEAISDTIDDLPEQDRRSGVLPDLHRLVLQRVADVRREFRRLRKHDAPPSSSAASTPTFRVVLCAAKTPAGRCRRRLVNRPCPLHPSSPGSRAVLKNAESSAIAAAAAAQASLPKNET